MKIKVLMLIVFVGGLILACGISPTVIVTPTQAQFTQTPTPWPTYPPPMPATSYLGFCQAIPPFDEVEIRKAFGLAIDRQALVDSIFPGREDISPATSFVPPDIWPDGQSRFGQVGLSFDPELARMGWEMGGGQIVVYELAFPEGAQDVAEFLQSQWKQYLGIDVDIVNLGEGSAYGEALDQCNYPMFVYGWYADYKSPYNFLFQCFHTTKSSNAIKWKNAEFDQVTVDAYKETNPTRQVELYVQAERILTETDVAIVPLYHYYHTP